VGTAASLLYAAWAMGLSLVRDRIQTARAIEFYGDLLSSLLYVVPPPHIASTARHRHSQLSSCYLTTVSDDLETITAFSIRDNAMLQKWAGGLRPVTKLDYRG